MLKKIISVLTCLIILLQLIFTSSCANESKKTKFNQYYFDYFDTATVITGYFETKEEFDKAYNELVEDIESFRKEFGIDEERF